MGGGPRKHLAIVRLAVITRLQGVSGILGVWGFMAPFVTFPCVLLVVVLGPSVVRLPQLIQDGGVYGPLASLGGCVGGIVVLTTIPEPLSHIPGTAPRAWASWKAMAMVGVCLYGIAVMSVFGAQGTALAVSIAVLATVGEGSIVAAVGFERECWVVPLAHVLAAMTFGAPRGEFARWAWIVEGTSVPGLYVSVLVFCVGLLAWVLSRMMRVGSDFE